MPLVGVRCIKCGSTGVFVPQLSEPLALGGVPIYNGTCVLCYRAGVITPVRIVFLFERRPT